MTIVDWGQVAESRWGWRKAIGKEPILLGF